MFSLEAILIWIESQIGRSEEDLVGQGFIPIAASPLKYNGRALIFYFDPSSEKIFTPRRNVRADEYAGGYIIAESPLDLLKYAADVVADTAARIDRNEVLSEISGYRDPVSLDQDDFNVTVRTAMIFHESSTNPDQYYHAYEITQSMRSDAPQSSSMRLQRRYWKIDDLAGNVDEVDGPGVIGQHPVLTPGKNHTYASRTSFATPEGLMSGFFTYCKLTEDDGPSYKMLKVPPFKLKSPVVDPELGNTITTI
ncbi:unnamed protein product [Oikopleura dioica]|uniref:ApaG domain-containing protein n=1 Tax=Oikopleura dioica TaxID=34765 RepID=E4YTN2_OIKDI|nr:unnamed protein product [Oikopleura dioica]